jgi:hypothetical protein
MRPTRLIALLGLLLPAVLHASVFAQDQGLAAITAPVIGANVSGVVTITGTATHPAFQRYELAFSYDPNPTDTWFTIQEPVTLPVIGATLGQWDTNGIVDGVYALRLRVYSSELTFIETVVRDVHVANAQPGASTPTSTFGPAPRPNPTGTATLVGQIGATPKGPATLAPTAPLIVVSPVARTAGAPGRDGGSLPNDLVAGVSGEGLQTAFLAGVRLTAVVFGLLGLYSGLRYVWRTRLRR